MTTLWQLSLGPIDEPYIDNLIMTKDLPFLFYYPKGDAKMADEPKINDDVLISCKAKLIAQGKIIREFHKVNNVMSALIQVNEIAYDKPYLKGYRRNWMKI